MFLKKPDRIAYAEKLLSLDLDPIPRYVIARQLLDLDTAHPDCRAAYEAVCAHPYVEKIAAAQNERGFWEPFHGTTEGNIRKLLSFGLDASHPTLARVRAYLVRLFGGEETTGQYE